MELTDYQLLQFKLRLPKDKLPDECWNWKGGIQKLGYGTFTVPMTRPKKTYYAHRLAYWYLKEPFDLKKDVLHTCDNPACCNPAHLFLGTHALNMLDKKLKGRAAGKKGEEHHAAKLTETQVIEIFSLRYKVSSTKLAEKYEVDSSMIRFIWQRKSWTHITSNIPSETVICKELSPILRERLKNIKRD